MSTLVIAEAGVNHNGSIDIAKKLIEVAADAGADYVKFQTFKAEKLVTKRGEKALYQQKLTSDKDTHFDMLKALEINENFHYALINHCELYNIKFLSTPFDLDSIDLLQKLNVPIFKIPSGEITNLPYLRKIGKLSKKVIMSTGMSTLSEVNDAINVLVECGLEKKDITILHCNTEYPTPFSDVNLRAISYLRKKLEIEVGYSDHTSGIEVAIAAVACGAAVIEKHFTLNNKMEGPDHEASLEPNDLKKMIKSIRNIELALGEKMKFPSSSEAKNTKIVRKSIVANCFIKKGEVFSEKNITAKRPGNGISPMRWDDIIGTKSKKDYHPDDLI